MLTGQQDCFYYITVMNEIYSQPSLSPGSAEAIVKGLHLIRSVPSESAPIRLVASGAIVPEAIEAAKLLQSDWSIGAEVWSATSYAELARDAARSNAGTGSTRTARSEFLTFQGASLGARPSLPFPTMCGPIPG